MIDTFRNTAPNFHHNVDASSQIATCTSSKGIYDAAELMGGVEKSIESLTISAEQGFEIMPAPSYRSVTSTTLR